MNNNSPISTLYVSDLDGTLLNEHSQVSAESAAMLNEAIERFGAQFTCATARTPATIVPLMQNIHMQLPMIAMAGAAMWNPVRSAYENVRTIGEAQIRQIVGIYERHGARPFVYRHHGGIIEAYHSAQLSAAEREFVEPRSHTPLKRFVLGNGYGSTDDYILNRPLRPAQAGVYRHRARSAMLAGVLSRHLRPRDGHPRSVFAWHHQGFSHSHPRQPNRSKPHCGVRRQPQRPANDADCQLQRGGGKRIPRGETSRRRDNRRQHHQQRGAMGAQRRPSPPYLKTINHTWVSKNAIYSGMVTIPPVSPMFISPSFMAWPT